MSGLPPVPPGFEPMAMELPPVPPGFEPIQPYRGTVLPFSRDQSGKVSFDSNAGVVGLAKHALGSMVSGAALPGDVVSGKARLPSSGAVPGSVEFGSPDSAGERVADMASWTVPVSAAVRAGERVIPGAARTLIKEKPPAPTVQALKDAADQSYKSIAETPLDIKASAVKDMGVGIQSGLEKDGIFAELAPKTFSVISRLQSPPEGSVATLLNIMAARRALGHAAGDFTNNTERLAASRAIEHIDSFVEKLPATDIVAGTPAAAEGAAAELAAARGNYAAAKRSDKITGAEERAERNAAVANSGQNLDNATRQQLKAILNRPKESRGYSPEELAQMERAARGTLPANVARGVGNLLGGGGGLGAVASGAVGGATAAAASGNPLMALAGPAVPALGYASKKLANNLTGRQVDKLDEMVRMRSPLYESMMASTPAAGPDAVAREMMYRALMASQTPAATSNSPTDAQRMARLLMAAKSVNPSFQGY